MNGWQVISLNDEGKELLLACYEHPNRSDLAVGSIHKIKDDPLTYEVKFKSKRVAKIISMDPETMIRQVYKGFAMQKKIELEEVKKLLSVVEI